MDSFTRTTAPSLSAKRLFWTLVWGPWILSWSYTHLRWWLLRFAELFVCLFANIAVNYISSWLHRCNWYAKETLFVLDIRMCKFALGWDQASWMYFACQVSIYGSFLVFWRNDSFLCRVNENDQFFFSLVHSLMEEKFVSWHSLK